MGNAQRLERWLRTPNLVAGIQAIAPAVAPAMINLDVAGMVLTRTRRRMNRRTMLWEVEMGVVGFAAVAAGLIDFDYEMIQRAGELASLFIGS